MQKHLESTILELPPRGEALTAEAAKLMELVSHTQAIGNWRMDLPSGNIFWSPQVYAIYGLPLGTGPIDLDKAIRAFHPQDAKTVAWLVGNAIEKKAGYTFTLRLQRADGEMRLVQSAAAVETDAAGAVVALYGIFKDVTDRYSDKDIAEGRGRLVRSIIAQSPAPLAVLDKNLNYLELSPSWIAHYDLPPARALIGKNHYEVMPALPEQFRETNQRALNGETIHSMLSYRGPGDPKSKANSAAIFPWRTNANEIGGIIIMLTPEGSPHAEDQTLSEIAKLYAQSGTGLSGDGAATALMPPRRVRAGTKW